MTPPNKTDSDEADDTNGRRTADDDTAAPESIDTTGRGFRQRIQAASDGKPFAPVIGFRAVTLRRITLEADRDEQSIADWIRDAVDLRLEHNQPNEIPEGDVLPGSRPQGYTPMNDTTDFELIEPVSSADPGDWFGARVEFPAGVLKAVLDNCDDGQTIADWVRSAVVLRFSLLDRELELKPGIEIEVPDEIVSRARFKAERLVALRGGDYDAELRNALHNLVNPQPVYTVDGDVIARFDADE